MCMIASSQHIFCAKRSINHAQIFDHIKFVHYSILINELQKVPFSAIIC